MSYVFQRSEKTSTSKGKFINHTSIHAAHAAIPVLQKKDDEEELQMKSAMQLKSDERGEVRQRKEQKAVSPGANLTGMPDQLKTGIENLSGYSMDDVRVHYNSDKPAQLSALAYAQGAEIHVAPGQERHLPHEAWHVVQQKQGRVRPTMQMKGSAINDDKGLETEADVMGGKASQFVNNQPEVIAQRKLQETANKGTRALQLKETLFQRQSSGRAVIQKFDAGVGAGWHIHHREHVKYDSNNATRVNFAGRTRRQIGYQWEQVIQDNGLAGTKGDADFIACKTWIRNNI